MSPRADRHPDLTGLALLTEVGSAGSVGAAAARFGISQPAASQRIRSLERDLGVALVERRTTGSRLTAAGAVIVEWAAPLLTAAAEFSAGAATLSAEGANHVRVAASLTVADYLIPRWLLSLRQLLPDVSVSLQPGNSEAVTHAVRTGEADLGFVEGPDAPSGVCSRPVADDDLVVVVGPGHPWWARTTPVTAQELARAPLVLREESSGTRRVFDHALAEYGLAPDPLMELGSTTAIKQAVRVGGYATVLSRLAVAEELAAHELAAVPTEGVDMHRKLRAIWRPATPPHGAAGALLAISAA
jgi:DNA-binding transcriptional LysR family regulator